MAYIEYNFTMNEQGQVLHRLVLLNGLSVLRTSEELREMGII